MTNQNLLLLAIEAAQAAGRVLMEKRSLFSILTSQGKDLKSEADLASEKAIFAILDPTGIPSLSEESRSNTKVIEKGRMWIIDPLDGTVNFTRGLPQFCVSIGLWEDGKPLLGVIYEPLFDQTYAGIVGLGATLNGQPVITAIVEDPSQGVLCTGFPTGRSYSSDDLARFVKSVQKFKKIRLFGSASICLAYVSAGKVDAYCEEDIWLWDVAAGLAIVLAAGGSVEYGPWNAQFKSKVIVTNGRISTKVLRD